MMTDDRKGRQFYALTHDIGSDDVAFELIYDDDSQCDE